MSDSAGLTHAAWFRYGAAVATVSIAVTLNGAVGPYFVRDTPAHFFPVAILLVAVIGGVRAGLLATGLAALCGIFAMDPPVVNFTHPQAALQLAVIVLEGLCLTVIGAQLGSIERPKSWVWPARYGAALVVIAVVLAVKLLLLDSLSRDYPFGLLFVAVAAAAWVGGLGPSLAVTVVAAVAAYHFWLTPQQTSGWLGEQTVRVLLFGVKGCLVALVCTKLHDAWTKAERRWADEASAVERYRQLVATIRDYAVFQLDSSGRVATWNPGASRILGWPTAAAIGRPYDEVATNQDRSSGEPAAELREAVESGRSERVGWRQRADGTRFWAETVVTASGDRPGFAVVLQDVSARRQAEEAVRHSDEQARQAQRLEAVGRLAGGIAHDFNNLLTVILGNVDLILEHDAPPEMLRTLLDDVRSAGRRAAVLTRQLLAFSRREQTAPRRIDLNSVVIDMGSMLRRVIAEHIALATELKPKLGPILADLGQVEQVLLNLVVNARDAMPKGGTLTIRTAETDLPASDLPPGAEGPPGRYVVLSVSDTGHGMDAATRARIFEPFFTTKEVGKGTGLGLATVYGNVKQAKGWVTVDSAPGQGATFRVYLPRADGPVESELTASQAEILLHGTETVLLVEDEPTLRDMARRALEAAGYTVLACPDGQAAIDASRITSGSIDLLVTDLVMPGMSGRELVTRLRKERRDLKVLFMSGYTESTLANLGGLESGEELLDKPFLPDDLARKVRAMLDQK